MKITNSSSTVKLFDENCPAALGFYEAGAPALMPDFRFADGIAAHAVLQVIGEKNARTPEQQRAVADAVVEELVTNGRTYRGQKEPPMAPGDATDGRDMALYWLEVNELPEGAAYELEYSAEALGLDYFGLVDCSYTETRGDEDFEYKCLTYRDYKSAWIARDNELETIQRRGHAVLARANATPDISCIAVEVCNLRLGVTYRREIMLDDEGEALIKQWARDIDMITRAMHATRTPRPGYNCIGCPYFVGCDDGRRLLEQVDNPARQWAGAKAMVKALEPILKRQAAEGPIDDGDGGKLGYEGKDRRQVNDDAIEQLCTVWYPEGSPDGGRGLLTAAGIGVKQVENIAKALYPGRDGKEARDELVDLCTETVRQAEFKVLA